MADAREITLSIGVDDNGTPVIKAFRDTTEKEFKKVESQTQTTTDRMAAQFEKFQNAWLKIGAVVAGTAWLQSAAKDALEAETAYNKLRIQVENMGRSYTGEMQQAINAASQYAMVQDEEVAKSLQQMIFLSGNVEGSMKNMTLAYDLAYQKGMSVEESSRLIGLAMTGNVEMLGRVMPEFRNLDDTLGKNATSAQKAAYAQAVFHEKVAGAMGQMTQHERMVRDITLQYEQLKQSVGAVVLQIGTYLSAVFNGAAAAGLQLASGVFKALSAIGALTDKIGLTSGAFEKWQIEATAAHEAALALGDRAVELYNNSMGVESAMKAQTAATHGAAAALAVKTKAESDAVEAAKKHTEELKKQEEGFIRLLQWSKKEEERLQEEARNNRIADMNARQIDDEMAKRDLEGLLTIEKERHDIQAKINALQSEEIRLQAEKYETAWKGMMDMANRVGGEMGKGLGMAGANMKGMADIASGQDPYSAEMDSLVTHYDKKIALMEQNGASEAQIKDAWRQHDLQQEQLAQRRKVQLASNAFGTMAGMMYAYYQASGQKNKQAFEAYKALSIAQTITDTYKAAMGAYSAMASIPYVGPALGAAAAAAAIAFGMAQVQAIQSTSPGGGASSTGAGTSTGVTGGGGYNYNQPTESKYEKEKQTQQVTVHVYNPLANENWDRIAEQEIIPAINRAGDRNVQLQMNVVGK